VPTETQEPRPIVVVDAMGGDDAPGAIVRGAADATLTTGAQVVLVGDVPRIEKELSTLAHDRDRLELVFAPDVIPMDASPRRAVQQLPDASLPVAARHVAEGHGHALVSAGNSGAIVLTCSRTFSLLPTIERAALAAVIPTERRRGNKDDPFSLLLDAGATVRVRPRDLVAFAVMGAAYARVVSDNAQPRVGLLSNGSEPNKGPPEVVEAHALLRETEGLDFIGNVEGVDIPKGSADVIVCDGFTGNITLKMYEGVAETVMNIARHAYRSRLTWRLALWLLESGIKQLKEITDWQQYGGAPVLGFDHLCIKAHGRSGPRAVRNAIRVAERCVRQDLIARIATQLASRPASPDSAATPR
jgi:glycerol-3-phosphate acyltransferase PlsX